MQSFITPRLTVRNIWGSALHVIRDVKTATLVQLQPESGLNCLCKTQLPLDKYSKDSLHVQPSLLVHGLFNMTWVVLQAWSFPWNGLNHIHSIQGLSHNLTSRKIAHLSLRHKSGYGHANAALKQPITPSLYLQINC